MCNQRPHTSKAKDGQRVRDYLSRNFLTTEAYLPQFAVGFKHVSANAQPEVM